MAAQRRTRWSRADIKDKVAPHRAVFSEAVFDFFDRKGWWNERKRPWRTLSREVSGSATGSEQNLERWLSGVMPSRKHVQNLADVLSLSPQTVQYLLDYNRWPDDPSELPSARSKLCHAITRLDESDCSILLIMAERMLHDEQQ